MRCTCTLTSVYISENGLWWPSYLQAGISPVPAHCDRCQAIKTLPYFHPIRRRVRCHAPVFAFLNKPCGHTYSSRHNSATQHHIRLMYMARDLTLSTCASQHHIRLICLEPFGSNVEDHIIALYRRLFIGEMDVHRSHTQLKQDRDGFVFILSSF